MTIGERIKEERTKAGLSQEQLAGKLGVSRSAVAKWESENGIPDIDNLITLSDMFSITIDELVRDDYDLKSKAITQREKRNKNSLYVGILFFISDVCLLFSIMLIGGFTGNYQMEIFGVGICALIFLAGMIYIKRRYEK